MFKISFYRIVFLSFCFLFNASLIFAQKDILELLPGSDKLTYNKKDQIHRFTGNVRFLYEGNPFYCDSAHYNKEKKWLKAFGNVHCIYNKEVNIYCDSMFYSSITRLARLRGNVRIRDFEYKITSSSMDYDFNKKCAYYRNMGRVEGITSDEVINSRQGYIYPSSKNFFFKGDVDYKKKNLKMLSDTLQFSYAQQTAYFFGSTKIFYDSTVMNCNKGWYNIKNEEGMLIDGSTVTQGSKTIIGDTIHYMLKDSLSEAFGNVIILDTLKGFFSNSNKAFNNEKDGETKLTGNVCLRKIDNLDTLIIQSDTIINFEDSINDFQRAKAYDNVSFKIKNIEAICDSMVLDSNVLNLFHQPIVWSDKTEMKGDEMKVFYKDSIVDSVLIKNNSTIIMGIGNDDCYNQISGKNIMAIFIDDTLKNAYVYGNAWTIFYPEEENKTDSSIVTKRMGMNRLFSSDIRIDIDSGAILGISYLEKPDGIFYPMNKIKSEEKFIKGFSWNPLLRPKMQFCRFSLFE